MKLDNIKIVKWISAVVAIIATLVVLGWFFDIAVLRSIIPDAISMRFITALAFLGCGLMLYSIVKLEEKNFESTAYIMHLIIASFLILLLMIISFYNVLGVNFSIEDLINSDYLDHSQTFPSLVPSISTMFNFILISLAGFITIFSGAYYKKILRIFGIIISAISLSVLLGYVLGIPTMYFALPGISNAMAIHTGILFLLIGIAFILLSNNNNNNTFTTRYSIQQKLIISSVILIGLTIILASVTTIILRENNINLQLIKEVEGPLEVMVQSVIGYDAMLTGNVHWAILDYLNNETDEVKERKETYDELGEKLDHLLKYDARELLEKSQRGTEDKQIVYGYLDELDKINFKLVDLETRAFAAIQERGDVKTALSLVCEGDYYVYKAQLADYYQRWADEEKRISDLYKAKNLNNLRYIFWANLLLILIIIFVGILMSRFIRHSIVNPLAKLDEVAKEISSGNIDVKISSESKKMPGIIGNIANSYDKLLTSSHLALKTLVTSKMAGKYESMYTSSKDAIMTLEPPSWNFTSGNPAAIKMFNAKDEKEFASLQPWQLSPKYQPNGELSSVVAKKMIEKAIKDGSNYFKWIHKRHHGKEFPATVLLSKVKEGKKTYLQATVRDLSNE